MTDNGTTPGFPEPGAMLGPFRLGRRLGLGGMGVVHEALDTQLQRRVALKIIAPHLAHDEDFRARFTREARAQASLDSTHVVQVHSFGEADGRLYIASQLIPDGDLGQLIADHGLPPPRIALHLLAQVADGLVDAHAAGLVHRDIKPANVLLRRRDDALSAYLADFGIARRVGGQGEPDADADTSTRAGAMVGTPAYMAPELHTGGAAGPACDVYSLGCLLWATLTGAAPYAGGTDHQVVSGHVSAPVPQLEPTGPLAVEVNRVLALALAKDPGRRYRSAQALRDDLRGVVRLPDDDAPLRPASAGNASSPPVRPPPTAVRCFHATAAPSIPTPIPPPIQPPGSRQPAPPAPGSVRQRGARRRGPAAGRARGWVPAAMGATVLAIAATVLVVVLSSGGSGGSGGDGGGDGVTAAGREARAVEALSGPFAAEAGVAEDDGACVAERVVADLGLEALIETGVLDEDLVVVDDRVTDPALAESLFSASFACAGG